MNKTIEIMKKSRKFGGTVNNLMVSVSSFYPCKRYDVPQKEMVDNIKRIQAVLQAFEEDENRLFLSAEELCSTDEVQLCTGLVEKYIHHKTEERISHNDFTVPIGDAILTSPIEGIYRCERRGYLPEKGFYVVTHNSYYMMEYLTPNESIRRCRQRVYEFCLPSTSCWLDFQRCTDLLWV